MIIGNFTYDPERDTYSGMIATLTAARQRVLFRPTKKTSEREPDYRIEHLNDHDSVELGAAWKRTSDKTGPFLSIVIDDPVLPASINAVLFHDKPPAKTARLVWTRPTAKPKAAEPERPPETPPRRPRAARKAQPA